MGQLDHCHHAVHIINELVQTAQVGLSSTKGFPFNYYEDNTFSRGWLKKANTANCSSEKSLSISIVLPDFFPVGARWFWGCNGSPRTRWLQHGRIWRPAGGDVRGTSWQVWTGHWQRWGKCPSVPSLCSQNITAQLCFSCKISLESFAQHIVYLLWLLTK